jgi:hypothetical protein
MPGPDASIPLSSAAEAAHGGVRNYLAKTRDPRGAGGNLSPIEKRLTQPSRPIFQLVGTAAISGET